MSGSFRRPARGDIAVRYGKISLELGGRIRTGFYDSVKRKGEGGKVSRY